MELALGMGSNLLICHLQDFASANERETGITDLVFGTWLKIEKCGIAMMKEEQRAGETKIGKKVTARFATGWDETGQNEC